MFWNQMKADPAHSWNDPKTAYTEIHVKGRNY